MRPVLQKKRPVRRRFLTGTLFQGGSAIAAHNRHGYGWRAGRSPDRPPSDELHSGSRQCGRLEKSAASPEPLQDTATASGSQQPANRLSYSAYPDRILIHD